MAPDTAAAEGVAKATQRGVYLVPIMLHIEAENPEAALDIVDVAIEDGPIVIQQSGHAPFEVGYINVPLSEDEVKGPAYDYIRRDGRD